MRDRSFMELVSRQWGAGRLSCVGLDPEREVVERSVGWDDAERAIVAFACAVVDATADLVAAYKPNIAFYERWGAPGLSALRQIIVHINAVAPTVAVIVDAKRGDIGSTNAVHGHEKVPAGGHEKSPLVATRSPHLSLKHPLRVSLGR